VIRVLIADDQALVRAGFHSLLDRAEDIEVVDEAVDGVDAVAQAARLRPDVVLMDVRMPLLDGIAATERIVADPVLAATHVVAMTKLGSRDRAQLVVFAYETGLV
jgi:DNA-binding NarL/FixJ family response regulator